MDRMSDYYLLEWTFTPVNFFEARVDILRPEYKIVIDSGKIEAKVDLASYPPDHTLRNALQEELNYRFLAVQVLSHESFTLSKASVACVHSNGRRDVWFFPEPIVVKCSVGNADFIIQDAAGCAVRDSKQERTIRKKVFADLVVKHAMSDATASAILRSYSAAVNDSANELIHLFEIRDALARHFGSENDAKQQLGTSRHHWSRLGLLANEEPLSQGRHRGRKVGMLRSAAADELSEARDIARTMIESYLKYIDSKGPTGP